MQGAGVSKNYVNPDGNYPDASGDFVGQGAANLFAGLFQGMPVGGSVSATSLVTNAGARTRFANIFAGITIAAVILLFGSAVQYIALPAIAGLLIVVGFRTLKPDQIEMVWKTGRIQKTVMTITFIACLLIPLQYAVLIGVALSVLLFVVRQSNQITVKEWEWEPGDLPIEHDAPEIVPSNAVTMLQLYGSVFFATAPLIEEKLPAVTDDTHNAAIVLIIRSEEDLGSTFLEVLSRYATDLAGTQQQADVGRSPTPCRDADESDQDRKRHRPRKHLHAHREGGGSSHSGLGCRAEVVGCPAGGFDDARKMSTDAARIHSRATTSAWHFRRTVRYHQKS